MGRSALERMMLLQILSWRQTRHRRWLTENKVEYRRYLKWQNLKKRSRTYGENYGTTIINMVPELLSSHSNILENQTPHLHLVFTEKFSPEKHDTRPQDLECSIRFLARNLVDLHFKLSKHGRSIGLF